jgi:hypothetical protein
VTAPPIPPRSTASVPLMALYGAFHLARAQGDQAVPRRIEAACEGLAAAPGASKIIKAATPSNRHVVPFIRDRMDVLVASLAGTYGSADDLRLFSNAALADVGYVVASPRAAAYVDRAPTTATAESGEFDELLPRNAVNRLVATLQDLDATPPRVSLPESPDHLLEIHCRALDVCCERSQLLQLDLALLRPDPTRPGSIVRRRLGPVKAIHRAPGIYALAVRPELTMEVHAAALASYALLLESPRLRFIAPLPDFDAERSGTDCWLQPTLLFDQALGVSRMPAVAVDRALSIDLQRRHRWFLPTDLENDLSAILAL